jgi:hypothetical protein
VPPNLAVPSASAFLQTALIVLLVALVLAAIVHAVLRWRARAGDEETPGGESGASAAPDAPAAPPPSPDDLAARGDLAEAIRVLLIDAMRATGWAPEGAGVSRTAREVLGAVAAGDPRRAPLAAIVGIAEHVRFGGAPPTREHYDRVRLAWAEVRRKDVAA